MVKVKLKRSLVLGIFDLIYAHNYFWRTRDQKEIDWVEMREGKLFDYETSYAPKRSSRAEAAWLKTDKEAEPNFVDKTNYLDFVL